MAPIDQPLFVFPDSLKAPRMVVEAGRLQKPDVSG